MIRRALRFLAVAAALGVVGCARETMPTDPEEAARTLPEEESEGLPRDGKVVFLVEDMGGVEEWREKLEDEKKKDPALAARSVTREDSGRSGHVASGPAAPSSEESTEGTEPGLIVPEVETLEENAPIANQESIEPSIVPAAPSAAAPVAILPAPAASQDRINQLVNKYDLVDVGGSAATVDLIDRVDALMSRFPEDSFRDLRLNFEVIADDTSAYWLPVSRDGKYVVLGDATELSDIGGGVITVAGGSGGFDAWSMASALGEHVARYQDASFGRAMMESLGYRLTAEGEASEYAQHNRWYMIFLPLDASGVASSSYATAVESPRNHVPDLIAYHLLKNTNYAGSVRMNASFSMPEETGKLLGRKLGS